MSKQEKAVKRIKSTPSDYTYSEAKQLLSNLGYSEFNKGKTSGSRVIFIKGNNKILLHKPHPGEIMKQYAVKQLKEYLEDKGEI